MKRVFESSGEVGEVKPDEIFGCDSQGRARAVPVKDSTGGPLCCVRSHFVLRSPLLVLTRAPLPSPQITVYLVQRRYPRVPLPTPCLVSVHVGTKHFAFGSPHLLSACEAACHTSPAVALGTPESPYLPLPLFLCMSPPSCSLSVPPIFFPPAYHASPAVALGRLWPRGST